MEELFKNQDFYENLNDDIKKLVLNLFKNYRKKKFINNISIYVYFIVGIVFLITFKEIIFYKFYISNINTLFELCKYFVIIGGLLSILNIISKKSSDEYKKSVSKIKSYLIMDVCHCQNKCVCKTKMIKFLSSLGFYLI